jgi:hypothetical protein
MDGDGHDPGPTGARHYAFGQSDAAAARLGVLAEVFEEPTRSLVHAVDFGPIDLALDLGCGPGYTTRMLAAEVQPRSLAGSVVFAIRQIAYRREG